MNDPESANTDSMSNGEQSIPKKKKRRFFRWRYVLVLLLILGYAGYRYGWPEKPERVASVVQLEEISWEEALELVGDLRGSRYIRLTPGEADADGTVAFRLEEIPISKNYTMRDTHSDIISSLQIEGDVNCQYYAGVLWIDLEDASADNGYAVLIRCEKTKAWEEGVELIIDMNRNLQLTDDPVLSFFDAWSDSKTIAGNGMRTEKRIFPSVQLTRLESKEGLPGSVEAIPCISFYYEKGTRFLSDRISLEFAPTSYRRGTIVSEEGRSFDAVISPDRAVFGQFGNAYAFYNEIAEEQQRDSTWFLGQWKSEGDEFWGRTINAEGTEIREGPYEGPIGSLQAETANGERMNILFLHSWRLGDDPRLVSVGVRRVIPRYRWTTLPHRKISLPSGQYGIQQMTLLDRGWQINISPGKNHGAFPPEAFAIKDDQTTTFQMPDALTPCLWGYVLNSETKMFEILWSSFENEQETNEQETPHPGDDIEIGFGLEDEEMEFFYDLSSKEKVHLTITDASDVVVLEYDMEYG
jgi:hypothetical protein